MPPRPRGESRETHRANSDPLELLDRMSDGLKHPPDLTVSAFEYRDLNLRVFAALFRFEPAAQPHAGRRLGHSIFKANPLCEALQRLGLRHTTHNHGIGFPHVMARMR